MKRFLTLTMALCLTLAVFAGCKNDDDKNSKSESSSSETDSSMAEKDSSKAEASKPIEDAAPLESGDMKVKIGEKEYDLPVPFEEFMNTGWTYSGDSAAELEADEYSTIEVTAESGITIKVFVINGSPEKKAMNQCAVGGFDIDADAIGDSETKVILNGDFDCFAATASEVKKKYGAPSYDEEKEDSILIEYEYKPFEMRIFEFLGEDGTLKRLEVQKFYY